jgi:uncharacterized protein (TIGR02145 family)
MKTTKGFIWAAGVSLALAFTFFGCSSDGDDGGGTIGDVSSSSDGNGITPDVSSSSVPAEISSSSSVEVVVSSSSAVVVSSSSDVVVVSSSSDVVVSSSSDVVVVSSSSAVVGTGLCAGFVEGTTREHYGKDKAQFCDVRDGKKYVYVIIGEQIWMAENLNYGGPESNPNGVGYCGSKTDNSIVNFGGYCDEPDYGRLYTWSMARIVCPDGWHLPSDAEWATLVRTIESVRGSGTAGGHLKTVMGWNNNGNGVDTYGFSAIPSGHRDVDGKFSYVNKSNDFWSSTEYNVSDAYSRTMNYELESVGRFNRSKSDYFFSVRCVKNN